MTIGQGEGGGGGDAGSEGCRGGNQEGLPKSPGLYFMISVRDGMEK